MQGLLSALVSETLNLFLPNLQHSFILAPCICICIRNNVETIRKSTFISNKTSLLKYCCCSNDFLVHVNNFQVLVLHLFIQYLHVRNV